MHIALLRADPGMVVAIELSATGGTERSTALPLSALPAYVREAERERPRWVWRDTRQWYPTLLESGVRVERCVDLALSHAILRGSLMTAGSEFATEAASEWAGMQAPPEPTSTVGTPLFEFGDDLGSGRLGVRSAASRSSTSGLEQVDRSDLDEFARQREAVATSTEPARLRLLLAAESAGALIAAEMRHAGLPWRTDRHEELLSSLLGPRRAAGVRPDRLEELARLVRDALDAPTLNPDSQADVLRALKRCGLPAGSTRSWELKKLEHPAIAPLLEYKKLARLASANGWAWMEAWISDGRFHPDYVPGGVVTGRWAARGGGALQLPRQVRGAVAADDGWKLVVADAAQLEPRILSGLASDLAMAEAGRGKDLYAGIVASGAVDERHQAKVAMLGAMYGATTGESGRLMPRLARAYPRAIRLVEDAARVGERGERVMSRLGRTSPLPGAAWRQAQGDAYAVDSSDADERRARSQAREWGRFTRNFVVQSTAAEWALCWMAGLRRRLDALTPPGARLESGPHLAYFLHDEVIVHTPAVVAESVAVAVSEAAEEAGRLLFSSFPVEFPVTTAIVDTYADAK